MSRFACLAPTKLDVPDGEYVQIRRLALLATTLVWLAGCSQDPGTEGNGSGNGSGNAIADYPDVTPIVETSLPDAVRSSSVGAQALRPFQLIMSDISAEVSASEIALAFEAFFKASYPKVSGGDAIGFLTAGLEDLDTRMAQLEEGFSSDAPDCVVASTTDYTLDLTQVHPSLSLNMNLSCINNFGEGSASYEGSGIAFGESNGTYSLLLLLNQPDVGGVFGYAANVSDVGEATERAELITFHSSVSQTPEGDAAFSSSDQMTVSRVIAKSEAQEFEIVIGSTRPMNVISDNISGTDLTVKPNRILGCGFRSVSDGSKIVLEGWVPVSGSDTNLCTEIGMSNFEVFDRNEFCFDAETLEQVACGTDAPEFTLDDDEGAYSSATDDRLDWRDMTVSNIEYVYEQVQMSKIQDEGVALTYPPTDE